MSTGDLSVTAEMSIEIDSSPDRSVYSADLGAGCDAEAGELESDFEAERLSNLAEEDDDEPDANDDAESQQHTSPEVEYVREKESVYDRKSKMNRSHFHHFFTPYPVSLLSIDQFDNV